MGRFLLGGLHGLVRERWRWHDAAPDMPLPALVDRDVTRVEALGDQLNKSNRQLAELREQLAAPRTKWPNCAASCAGEPQPRPKHGRDRGGRGRH